MVWGCTCSASAACRLVIACASMPSKARALAASFKTWLSCHVVSIVAMTCSFSMYYEVYHYSSNFARGMLITVLLCGAVVHQLQEFY